MLVHELTLVECRDVLSRAHIARLACSRAGQPYVVPISFTYDQQMNCLFSFSAVGRKVQWMRENPKVCLEVEEVDDRFHWTTVVVFGRYDEIDDSPEQQHARHRALHLLQKQSEWWLPGGATLAGHEPRAIVVYRIQIESVTGRRAARERT